MNALYLLIFLVIILLLFCFLYQPSKPVETFTNPDNIITDGDFREGKHPLSRVGASAGFAPIPLANPGSSSYVLKHVRDPENPSEPYKIQFNLVPGNHYMFKYWYANTLPVFEPIDSLKLLFLRDDGRNMENGPEITVSETKDVNSVNWELRKTVFQIPENSNGMVQIMLGSSLNKPYTEYFTQLHLQKSSPMLQGFKYTSGLNLFLLSSTRETNLVKDLSLSGNDAIFVNPFLKTESNLINIESNTGSIKHAGKILPANSFTLAWSIGIRDNTKGVFLEIKSDNKIKRGLKISYDIGTATTKNTMTVEIGRWKYLYNVGIIQRIANYALIYSGGQLDFYIDGYKLEPESRTTDIPEPKLGNCPDGWQLQSNGQCKFVGRNKGVCMTEMDFTNYNNDTKREWAARCKVPWSNCDVLTKGQNASETSNNCVMGDELIFGENSIVINPDQTFAGFLDYLLGYGTAQTVGTVQRLPEEIAKYRYKPQELPKPSVWNSELEKVLNTAPSTIKGSTLEGPIPTNVKGVCPFLENETNSPCNSKLGCNIVDWDEFNREPLTVNESCKKTIQGYCQDNTKDPTCLVLKQNKKLIESFTSCSSCTM